MPMRPHRIASLLLLGSLWLVSGCASKIPVQSYPPPADLAVETKPVLDPTSLDSDKALNDYDVSVEGWGERGWKTVSRLCHWAKDNGMKNAPC